MFPSEAHNPSRNPEGDFCVILFCTFGEGINESADEDNRGSRSSDRP